MNACDAQDQVLDFLQTASTHGRAVRRIDTHISSIFLAGPQAYKVKRSVRYPFLDFSTLQKRKSACEAEVEINRRFAPQIYRGVVAITQNPDGSLAIGGAGKVIEWVVEMSRFDEDRTLDRLAEEGLLDTTLSDTLGRTVAEMHEQAPIVSGKPWSATLRTIIEQNNLELGEQSDLFPPLKVSELFAATRRHFKKCESLLLARSALGFVRRGHGDLHLGNIVMISGRPVPFDALEFDPLMASTDVLYDLAFVLMDLLARGLTAQANIAFNRYLTTRNRLDDLDGLTALPLFLSVRAAIRAKVLAERLKFVDSRQRAKVQQDARHYFDLACHLIDPPAPCLVAIGGLSGTGKSALARMFAPDIGPAPGAVILRSDVERKLLFGHPETEKLSPIAYTEDASTRVYALLQQKAERLVTAGHSAIVDAVFSKSTEREAMATVATKTGAAFLGLFLKADLPTRLARLAGRGPDASDADRKVAQEQESYDLGKLDWHSIDVSGTEANTLQLAKAAVALRTTVC